MKTRGTDEKREFPPLRRGRTMGTRGGQGGEEGVRGRMRRARKIEDSYRQFWLVSEDFVRDFSFEHLRIDDFFDGLCRVMTERYYLPDLSNQTTTREK